MIIECQEQRSAEWLNLRLGCVTASNIARAMKKLTRASGDKKAGDWAGSHDEYVREIAWELITRTPAQHYVSQAMDLGTEFEGEAKIEFWMASGIEVKNVGLVRHPTINFLKASPDGLLLDEGILEVKVPLLKTHQQYLIDDIVPEEYVPQMQCQMLCCEASYGEFVSYAPPDLYPELPEEFRLFRKRLPADPAVHRLMEEAAIATMAEATALVEILAQRYPREESSAPRASNAEETASSFDASSEDFAYLDGPGDAP